jgi:hypothetical protein
MEEKGEDGRGRYTREGWEKGMQGKRRMDGKGGKI